MTSQVRSFARRALWALPVWAAMLFAGTLTVVANGVQVQLDPPSGPPGVYLFPQQGWCGTGTRFTADDLSSNHVRKPSAR